MAQSIPTHIPQWSDSTEIPNQRSKTGPSLAVFNGVLQMVHLGDSSDDIWHSTFEGGHWTENRRIDIKSRGIVAFIAHPSDPTALGLLIYLGVNKAADGSYPLMVSPCGPFGNFGGGTPLPGNFTSNHTPAVTFTPIGWLVVSVVGSGNAMRFAFYSASPPFSLLDEGIVKNQTTKTGPALATYANNIHLLHLGSGSNTIWHSLFIGTNFTTNVPIKDQSSQATPSMAVFRDTLHMVHLGSGSDRIWHSTYKTQWLPNVLVPGQTSSSRPALAATADALHLVHKGAGSNRLWHCMYR